jgi:DNA-binding MarR family transcriptional regulator
MSSIKTIRDGLRQLNRFAGVLKTDPYGVGLTLSQSSALVDLERFESLRPLELARHLQLEKSSISRLVEVLASKHFILISDDPNDRRSKMLRLTDKGKETVKKIHRISDQIIKDVLKYVPEKEHVEISQAFEKIIEAFKALESRK